MTASTPPNDSEDLTAAYAPQSNVLLVPSGIPTNGEATVRIGDGPALTRDQVAQVLAAGGVPPERAIFAASMMLKGTVYPPLVQRTAQDTLNEAEVRELREHRELLLGLVRKALSPLQVQALDVLRDWQTGASLAETLGVTPQHASNLVTALHRMGLLERKHLPTPGPGRSSGRFRTVDAVHGPERDAEQIEAVRAEARRLRDAS